MREIETSRNCDKRQKMPPTNLDVPTNLMATLDLNSPSFSESSLWREFARVVNLFQVVTHDSEVYAKKIRDSLSVQPKGVHPEGHDACRVRRRQNEGEEIHLDALSDLVGAYKDEHHAIEPTSDAEMLQHLLDAKGITQAQLSRETDLPKSTISEVLKGKKRFSRQMIHKLAEYFQVDVTVLAANI
jgi:HTH-type transcriptional regulator/antitoxin HigA